MSSGCAEVIPPSSKQLLHLLPERQRTTLLGGSRPQGLSTLLQCPDVALLHSAYYCSCT
jgi:hypothetical protein